MIFFYIEGDIKFLNSEKYFVTVRLYLRKDRA